MSVEYDETTKRLFVADTWNDRVLVYDMTPDQVKSGMAASHVLGQKDFTSYEPGAAPDRLFYGSRNGNGIGRVGSRSAEMTLDETYQRLFVTDGGNHRIMVFDVHPDRIKMAPRPLRSLVRMISLQQRPGYQPVDGVCPGI